MTQLPVIYQRLEPRAIITQTIHKPHKVSGPIRATSSNLSALLSADISGHNYSETRKIKKRTSGGRDKLTRELELTPEEFENS